MINEKSQRLIEDAKAILRGLLEDKELKGVLGLATAGVREALKKASAETDIADTIENLTDCCELLMLAGSRPVSEYEIRTGHWQDRQEANRRLRRGATMDLCAIVKLIEVVKLIDGENVLTN